MDRIDINNFTQVSEFPAIGRSNGKTVSITFPTTSLAPNASSYHSEVVAIGSGDIITSTILMNGTYYPVGFLQIISNNFLIEINVQRISPTEVEVVYYVSNQAYTTRTFNANTATVYISAFNVP